MASPLGARPLPGPLLFARLISRGRECTEHLLTVYQQKGKDQITSLGAIHLFFQIKAMWTQGLCTYRSTLCIQLGQERPARTKPRRKREVVIRTEWGAEGALLRLHMRTLLFFIFKVSPIPLLLA